MEIYDISVKDINGENVSLERYRGKVLLIVNTASKCGFTKQFDGLEELYEKYKDEGFEVLGFPCNQFKEQDPGSNSEIMNFCKLNFGVTFPMFEKIDVNGENESLLYSYLKEQKSGMFGSKIKWNFTKFLVDREGNVIKRFSPQTTPKSIEKDIEELLAK
ncbi:glutathione peroxidase [Clostridium perfringens]|nr:glutathione peroxidase [Clostridium perfringens]EJT5924454.1 glutathione peroxidase [Clostridium perfringens]MDK0721062.1 glutathione peroxidase [Clostridium perfringens]MDK0768159.1 glutathione peroxidase [Clostridium perfringens]MDK0770805.1 glutathione peroxidase [Clostridium perfringens]MDK0775831.1 glutathione peroxidase [Clostridium perfringens]